MPILENDTMLKPSDLVSSRPSALTRRDFLTGTGAAALGLAMTQPAVLSAAEGPKIKVGLIGAGGRGQWIIDLFAKHGIATPA
jgi:hypothetical protein